MKLEMTHSDVENSLKVDNKIKQISLENIREAYRFMYACLNIQVQSNTGVYMVLYTHIIWKILTVHVEI